MAVLNPNEIFFTAFEPKQANRFVLYVDGIPSFMIKEVGIKGKIEIKEIREVIKGKTLWVGLKPATARKGLIIKYGKFDEIYMSPQTNDEFINRLFIEIGNLSTSFIDINQSQLLQIQATIPAGLQGGNYSLIAIVDYDEQLVEKSEDNNINFIYFKKELGYGQVLFYLDTYHCKTKVILNKNYGRNNKSLITNSQQK